MDLVFFAKTLGFSAFFITSFGYLNKKDSTLKKCIAISAGILSIHYFLLLSWVAGINLAINFVRNQIATKKSGYKWFSGFALFHIVTGIVFYNSNMDIFPVIGSLLSGYALFCSKGIKLRVLMLICTFMWFLLNLVLQSYGAVLQDSLSMTMNMIGIIKLKKSHSLLGMKNR